MKTREKLVEELDMLEKKNVELRDIMYKVPDDPAETMFHMERCRKELQDVNQRIETINWILNDDRE